MVPSTVLPTWMGSLVAHHAVAVEVAHEAGDAAFEEEGELGVVQARRAA